MSSSPYLLIVCGPTGSGKGSLPEKVIKYLNINDDYVGILIDDLVEENLGYKKKCQNI